jgi:hypothetical protein
MTPTALDDDLADLRARMQTFLDAMPMAKEKMIAA